MIFNSNNTLKLAQQILLLGQKLKDITERKDFSITVKSDKSRVTTADIYADEQIKLIIKNIFGDHLVLSEEDSLENQRKISSTGNYFIIDPIDGTESFIVGDDFCINIAYCKNNIPLFGMIAMPVQNIVYYTLDNSIYSFNGNKTIEIKPNANTTDLATGKKTYRNKETFDKMMSKLPNIENIFTKNAGIKYLSTIIGLSGITLNFNPVKDWDIAMIFAMVSIFEYEIFDGNGKPIIFGINDFSHNSGIYLTQNKKTADLIKFYDF